MSSPLLSSIDRVHEGAGGRAKDREKALLFREVCTGRSPTRTSLARRLGIRPSSVSEAIQELLDDGLVKEAPARGRSGRPRLVLAPAPDRLLAISIYVDSRELRAVLVNLQESVLAEEARALGVEAGNRQLGDAIRTLARSLSGRVPARSTLVGASLSLVGTVNPRTRTWVSAARWPKLRGLDLSGLESRIGFPIVLRRTNDVELAYFLECNPHLAAVNALLLHWGFGIGSAVSFRGIPLSSSLGRFGEIGHSRVGSGGDAPCLCGSRGCLEATAALWALHPLLQRRLGRLPEDERALGPLLGSRGLLELPELRQALQGVQAALHTLYLIFYPDVILLSGPFPENGAVFGELARGFTRSLPDYAKGAVKLAAIPGGMGGCRLGGASPLFRDSLRRALRRKP